MYVEILSNNNTPLEKPERQTLVVKEVGRVQIKPDKKKKKKKIDGVIVVNTQE